MCTKIVRKLVSEGFLREDIETNKYGAVMYIKLGPSSHKLLNDFSKETFHILTEMKSRPSELLTEEDWSNSDEELRRLEDNCFSELKTEIQSNFPELKSVYHALPVTAYREIAQKLPDTNSKLLEIDQMTETRVQKYGKVLLEVCRRFTQKRMAYLKDKQTAENLAREDAFEAIPEPSISASSGWISKNS